jgi:TP901 family phage tail tape measure protein
LGQTDREIVAQQIGQIRRATEASSLQAKKQIGDLRAIRAEKLRDMSTTREQIAQIKEQQRVRSAEADMEIAKLREVAARRGTSYEEQIRMIRRIRSEEKMEATSRLAELREMTVMERDAITAIEERIGAIKEAERAEIHEARTSIAAIREQAAAQEAAAVQARSAAFGMMTRGHSMITGGVLTAAVGGVALHEFSKMADAAQAYNQQVAKTKTQTDKVSVSFKQLADTGRRVASTYAVQFDQVQGSLYDIYSSMDTTAKGAETTLAGIAKAAVAGAAPMESTGRAAITIMNAYKMKASDINHVNDEMFQLVRKGVGTYEQFTNTIGRSVPSAIRAGQSLESLNGILAFLTRNGLSAAMASASAGRALDSIANFKTVENFRAMGKIAKATLTEGFGKKTVQALQKTGVSFKNMDMNLLKSNGKMKSMTNIVTELNKRFQGLTKEQKGSIMQSLLKGSGGTIQAMRFWNHALNDSNNLLGEMTSDMHHAQGATNQAYKVMRNTPQAQIQLLNNKWQATKTILGNYIIPLKLKLLHVLNNLLGSFNKLSPAVQKFTIYTGLAAAATLLLGGLGTALAGIFTVIRGAIAAAGITMGEFTLTAGLIVAAIAAIGFVVYEVITHWKDFKDTAAKLWADIAKLFKPVQDAWNAVYPTLKKGWENIVSAFQDAVQAISKHGKDIDDIFTGLQGAIQSVMQIIVQIIKFGWPIVSNALAGFIRVAGPIIGSILHMFAMIANAFDAMPQHAQQIVLAVGIIAFALRSQALTGLQFTRFGTAFSGMVTSFRNSAGKLNAAISGIAAGALVGNFAGQIKGVGGKIAGALGGAGAGALIGSVFGPWGAAIGGLAGGVTGLVAAWNKQGDAARSAAARAEAALAQQKQDAQDLYQTLISVNGAYNKIYKSQLAQKLQAAGAYTAAQGAGINPSTVTQAALGNSAAIARMNAQAVRLQKLTTLAKSQVSLGPNGEINETLTAAQVKAQQQFGALVKLQKILGQESPAVKAAEQKWEQYQAALGKGSVSAKDLAGGLGNLHKELKNTGTSLNQNTAFGVRNNAIVIANIKHVAQSTAAQIRHGESYTVASHDMFEQLSSLRQVLAQMGFNGKQIDALIAKYGRMPKSVVTAVSIHDTATTKLQKIQTALAALHDKTISISTYVNRVITPTVHNKNTGLGLDPHNSGFGGGYLRQGYNYVNEHGTELLYKSGANVRVMTHAQSLRHVSFDPPAGGNYGYRTVGTKKNPDYKFGGHRYATRKALHSAINSARQTIKNTKIPSLMDQLFGTPKELRKSLRSLLSYVRKFTTSDEWKKLQYQHDRLMNMSQRLDKLTTRISNVRSHLSNMKQARSSLGSTVSGAISGTFDVGSEQGSFTDIAGDLKQDLKDARTFRRDIKKLRNKGYGDFLISQLYQQGPAALPTIESLLTASKPQAKKFMAEYRALRSTSKATGKQIAGDLYDAGIKAAQGLLDGLVKKRKALRAAMRDLADTMVNEIKKRLKIKSPSRVFENIGLMNMKGLDNGHNKGYRYVQRTIHAIADDIPSHYDRASSGPVGGGARRGGDGKKVVNFHEGAFQITTQEINPVKHAADLGWELARRVI